MTTYAPGATVSTTGQQPVSFTAKFVYKKSALQKPAGHMYNEYFST